MSTLFPDPARLKQPMSDEETEELADFLASEAAPKDTMPFDMLDGYLTAILIGPKSVSAERWLPGVWGEANASAPKYASAEEAQHVPELMQRHMNDILWNLQHDADAFEPYVSTVQYEDDPREYLDGELWAHGFLAGIELCRADWQPLFDDPEGAAALRPLQLLGADELSEEEEALSREASQREALADKIATSVAAIYRFWLPLRDRPHERLVVDTVRRGEAKVGRNDPCPCGSGKKFKRCCGQKP